MSLLMREVEKRSFSDDSIMLSIYFCLLHLTDNALNIEKMVRERRVRAGKSDTVMGIWKYKGEMLKMPDCWAKITRICSFRRTWPYVLALTRLRFTQRRWQVACCCCWSWTLQRRPRSNLAARPWAHFWSISINTDIGIEWQR